MNPSPTWRWVIRLLARTAVRMVVTMVVATFFVFVVVERSIRGGLRTVILPPGADPESPDVQRLVEEWNLDGSLVARYLRWLGDAVRGDFGLAVRGRTPVTDLIGHRLSISLEIVLLASALTLLIGIPLGLWAASRSHRGRGRALTSILSVSQSIPVFVTPLILTWLFALELGWLPAAGWVRLSDSVTGNLRSAALPVIALALAEIGIVGRIVQTDAARVMSSNAVTSAFAKGLPAGYVMRRHVLRPASLGLVNVIGLNIGSLLSGALIVELVFGIGGLGQVLLESTINRDLNPLLGLTVYTVGVYVVLNALVDLVMPLLDPRIRGERIVRH